jgi:TonB family protein
VLDIQQCESLDSRLRAGLAKLIPGIQFISNDDVAQELKEHGFLSIDVYDEFLLRAVASDTGAEIVVIYNLVGGAHGYELSSKIVNVSGDKEIGTFKAKIAQSSADTDDKPVLVKDAGSEVSLVVSREHTGHSRQLYYPSCMKCPEPEYTDEARRKGLEGVIVFLVTISDQGVAEQISLVKTFDASLTASAVQTIHGWRLKPAIGADGKPFAARVPVQVTYRLRR